MKSGDGLFVVLMGTISCYKKDQPGLSAEEGRGRKRVTLRKEREEVRGKREEKTSAGTAVRLKSKE